MPETFNSNNNHNIVNNTSNRLYVCTQAVVVNYPTNNEYKLKNKIEKRNNGDKYIKRNGEKAREKRRKNCTPNLERE